MKFLATAATALFAVLSPMSISASEPIAEHVILIGLDGWGAYSYDKADMPNIKNMAKDGCYTLKKRSVLPSSSAVNWASMYMGAGPELHGYTEWGSRVPELPSRIVDEDGIFPTMFGLLRQQHPEAVIGNIAEWDGIRYVCDTLALNLDQIISEKPLNQSTTAAACDYIKSAKPTLLNIVYDEPDHVGHGAGHDTPQYYAKLHELDSCVAEIVQATKDAGIYDNSIIIVTADHGGIGKGHGGKTMQEMETPFIILGKGVRKGGNEIPESMMQFDIAPTIAHIFGLETPQVWIGRPVLSVFE